MSKTPKAAKVNPQYKRKQSSRAELLATCKQWGRELMDCRASLLKADEALKTELLTTAVLREEVKNLKAEKQGLATRILELSGEIGGLKRTNESLLAAMGRQADSIYDLQMELESDERQFTRQRERLIGLMRVKKSAEYLCNMLDCLPFKKRLSYDINGSAWCRVTGLRNVVDAHSRLVHDVNAFDVDTACPKEPRA